MGVANVPSAAGGGIKLVQRGSAGASGNVTITAVDITKAFVNVFGTASSGTVAASGAVSAYNGNIAANTVYGDGFGASDNGGSNQFGNADIAANTFSASAANLSGGTNNLVAAVVQGYLSNSTTLVVSGACRWEVVEFA
jgi:hypothetical protein